MSKRIQTQNEVAGRKASVQQWVDEWLYEALGDLPEKWRDDFADKWRKVVDRTSIRIANEDMLKALGVSHFARCLMVCSDGELQYFADRCAERCALRFVAHDGAMAYVMAERDCNAWQVMPPSEGVGLEGQKARMGSPVWWFAGLRKARARCTEEVARSLGYVGRHAGLYASDEAVRLRRSQKRRNAALLDGLEVVSEDTGTVLDMSVVADASLANPDNRRAELMTRIRGMEEVAAERKDCAAFITITCPSRFHARRSTGGKNGKWKGATPRHAQQYLCEVWARIRASIARRGAVVYGIRIAEPHHDGTPHWHLCLFMSMEWREPVRELMEEYACKDSPEELGEGGEARFKWVDIDPEKGSAAGYVLKYVCKNLGGIEGEGDREAVGVSSAEGAERVEAWAATWGIRQFQQIGGHYVSAWRELRRIEVEDVDWPQALRDAWGAANPKEGERADFAGFIRALGGVETRARDALVMLWTEVEEREGRYGLALVVKPQGVESAGVQVFSEREAWVIRPKSSRG